MSVRRVAALLGVALALAALPARLDAQGAAAGTSYVLFWRGDLRIIATRPNTQVTLTDVNTGLPLSPLTYASNFTTNPFDLRSAGDQFEGDSFGATVRVRVVADRAAGPREDKPVIVWTGDLEAALKHPPAPPVVANAWLSYLPALAPGSVENGTEIGRNFWGFCSREMYLFARRGGVPTSILVEDVANNVDLDGDDTVTLTPASASRRYQDAVMEVYVLTGFEDDTVHVTSNVDLAVAVGAGSDVGYDWTLTPPSFGPGEDARELGTLFYAYVARDLTIFPTQDNTNVTITDLSEGDDSIAVALRNGDLVGDYDIFVTDLYARNGTGIIPRAAGPAVRLVTGSTNAPFENDLVKVEADRPVLVYLGPKASDVNEYADVAYSMQTGPTSYVLYAYAQNGGAEDLQFFVGSPTTNVQITSLTATAGFRGGVPHDFSFPTPTPYLGGNATTGDWYWASGVWSGEMLRFTSDGPITIIDGDYDGPNFGCYIPFLSSSGLLLPIADAGPDVGLCPGQRDVTLDGSGSFDADTTVGAATPAWSWDLDATVDTNMDGDATNDADRTGPIVTVTLAGPGPYAITLTFTDDDGQRDTDVIVVAEGDDLPPLLDCPVLVTAVADPSGFAFADVLATVSDNCDANPQVTNDRTASGVDASDVYPCGPTFVEFVASDSSGNTTSCDTRVLITDALPPEITAPARIDVVSDPDGTALVALVASAFDACDPAVTITNDRTAEGADASDAYPCGTTVVTFTASDSSGNATSAQTTVVVADGTPPALTCPARLDAAADSPTGATVAVLATGDDLCDPVVAIENDRTAGGADATDFYPCGETTVTFTGRDTAGNTGTCSSVVSVTPPTPPVGVGAALRVSKDVASPTPIVVLRWNRAPAIQPWEHYTVYRDAYTLPVTSIRPFDPLSTAPTLTTPLHVDLDASASWLLFYEVFTADCLGREAVP